MLAPALALAFAAAAPLPQLAVVHDEERSLEDARLVTARLNASGKVQATLREIPLSASCTRTTACVDRPVADAIVSVSRGITSTVHVELIAMNGAALASEVVDVGDPALEDAALAPPLARIEAAAVAARAPSSSPSVSQSALPAPDAADEGNAWMPWVLGSGAVCAGVCALALGGAVVYAMVVSAQEAGNAAGNACGDALTQACTAPFDACSSGVGDIGNACSGIGDGCSGAGDSLGSACDGVGNIGACAVMPALALAADEPGDPRPINAPPASTTGAMRF